MCWQFKNTNLAKRLSHEPAYAMVPKVWTKARFELAHSLINQNNGPKDRVNILWKEITSRASTILHTFNKKIFSSEKNWAKKITKFIKQIHWAFSY